MSKRDSPFNLRRVNIHLAERVALRLKADFMNFGNLRLAAGVAFGVGTAAVGVSGSRMPRGAQTAGRHTPFSRPLLVNRALGPLRAPRDVFHKIM